MDCPKCGSQVNDGSDSCPACGAAMGRGDEVRIVDTVPETPVCANRSLLVWIVLSVITCGIYSYYFIYALARDMNRMCRDDGEHTPGLVLFMLLSIVTFGFYTYWWYYKIGNRLQANAPAYGLSFKEGGATILLWQIVGLFLCGLGPFISMYIIIKNTNALAAAYNARLAQR